MTLETIPWDAAEYLDDNESIAAYLAEVMEMGDPAHIVHALGTIARARGMTQIARDAGVGRQALYKSLGADGNPTLTTLIGVIKSLGLTLSVRA